MRRSLALSGSAKPEGSLPKIKTEARCAARRLQSGTGGPKRRDMLTTGQPVAHSIQRSFRFVRHAGQTCRQIGCTACPRVVRPRTGREVHPSLGHVYNGQLACRSPNRSVSALRTRSVQTVCAFSHSSAHLRTRRTCTGPVPDLCRPRMQHLYKLLDDPAVLLRINVLRGLVNRT